MRSADARIAQRIRLRSEYDRAAEKLKRSLILAPDDADAREHLWMEHDRLYEEMNAL